MTIEGAPRPVTSIESARFWDGCARGELLLQDCANGHTFFPPAAFCPRCWSREVRSSPASGRGTVFSFVTFRRSYHPAFRDALPYTVAVITLAEGPRFLTRLVDVVPDDVRVGMTVQVTFVRSGDVTLPLFRPER